MKRNNQKKQFKFNGYLFLIMLASLFLSVGYAAISAVHLTVGGTMVANVQEGIFISDVVCNSGNGVSATVYNNAKTTMHSAIALSSNNANSTVTCTVTIFNNYDVKYYYNEVVYDATDPDFYSNADIVPTVSLSKGDEVDSGDAITFTVTFGYKSGVTPGTSNNTLDSYINFSFVDDVNGDVKLVDAITALVANATPTNGLYNLGTGASGCTYTLAYDDTSDVNLRYVGANPCNYVTFSGSTWRIIGVINNVPASSSTNHDSLVKLINPSAYNNTSVAYHNKNNTNTWTSMQLYTDSLSTLSVTNDTMVESVLWYNGGPSANSNTANQFYVSEIATKTSAIKIGLISVSDYGFATDNISSCRTVQLGSWNATANLANCVTNHNWLFLNSQTAVFTTSTVSGRKTMYRINPAGNPYAASVNSTGYAYPVVYLKNGVLVDDGDGDANSPFTLK